MSKPSVSLLELLLAALLAPLAVASWAALVSAWAARFSPALAVLGAGLAAALALGAGFRLVRRGRLSVSAWDLLALLACLVLLARARPAAAPWPVYLDASWYQNTAARIAQEGALRFEVPAFELLERPEVRRLVTATFADQRRAGLPFADREDRGFFAQAFALDDPASGRVGPYHPPFFAAGLALAARGLGPSRAAEAGLAWALAWLLAVAALARRAFGPRAGPLAAVLVGLGPLPSYYGGQPYAELAAGSLLLAGLLALTHLAGSPRPAPAAAALAGLTLGLSGLVKIDVLPALASSLVWWALVRARRGGRAEAVGLLLGLAGPALQALGLAAGVSRLYYQLNLGGVARLLLERWPALTASAAVALLMAALLRRAWLRRAPGQRPRVEPLGRWLGLALILGLGLASVASGLTPADGRPSMLAILTWAATPLGLWLGAAGLVLSLDRLRPDRGPLLALALTALPLVLLAPVVTRSLSPLYAARRLLPLALPLTAVLAAGALVMWTAARDGEALARLGGARLRRATGLAAALLVLWASLIAARPFVGAGGLDFAGGGALARGLARSGQPGDLLLFTSTMDGASAGRLAAATWNLTGRPVAVLGAPDPAPRQLQSLVADWRASGRDLFLVADGGREPPDFGAFRLVEVDRISVVSQAPAPDPRMPPRLAPLPIELVVYELASEAVAP